MKVRVTVMPKAGVLDPQGKAIEGALRALVERVARAGAQVERVEQRTPHVVLLLAVGVVADPDRLGAVVAVQGREDVFLELTGRELRP